VVTEINKKEYFQLDDEEDEIRIEFDKMWLEEGRIFFRFSNGTTPSSKFSDGSYYNKARYRNEFRKEEKENVYSIPLNCFTHLSENYCVISVGGELGVYLK